MTTQTLHKALTPALPFVDELDASYDHASQLLQTTGDDVQGYTPYKTSSWKQTNGNTDCSPLYTDDTTRFF